MSDAKNPKHLFNPKTQSYNFKIVYTPLKCIVYEAPEGN